MRKTVFEVGVALAAAAALTVVVIATEHLMPLLRWVIVAIVAIVAFVGAWLAARRILLASGRAFSWATATGSREP